MISGAHRAAFALGLLMILFGLTGMRCERDPNIPPGSTGGYGDTPAVGGSLGTGGAVVAETGGEPATGGNVVACDAVERQSRPRRLDPRVVGGEDAPLGAFPWVCSLQTPSGWHYCGGSLTGPQEVTTAAHCGVDSGDVVLCGRTVLSGTGGETRRVSAVRSNPGWSATTSGDDVALLRIDAPILTITPIGLGPVGVGPLYVLGWGRTSEGGPAADHLQIAELESQSCSPYGSSIDETMLCAGGNGRDGCSGDSGGPLLQNGRVVGLTSWGNGCAKPGWPGVWTDVGAVYAWIANCRW